MTVFSLFEVKKSRIAIKKESQSEQKYCIMPAIFSAIHDITENEPFETLSAHSVCQLSVLLHF